MAEALGVVAAVGAAATVARASSSTCFQPVKGFKIKTYKRNLPHYEQPRNCYFINFRASKNLIMNNA